VLKRHLSCSAHYSTKIVNLLLRHGVELPNYNISEWVSEWVILSGTSAQLGYTVPFTLVHAGQKTKLKKQTIQKLSTTQKKPTTRNTAKQNSQLAWFSRHLWHLARKRGRLILQNCRAHTMQLKQTIYDTSRDSKVNQWTRDYIIVIMTMMTNVSDDSSLNNAV